MADIANNLETFDRVRDTFVNTDNPPTSAAVQVARLWHPDVKLEIQANAIKRR